MREVELTIDSIAAGGDGVARDAGRVVFVPRTAPGDVALVRLVEEKERFARGRLAAVRTPSPSRIEPPCPHYVHDDCGGCQLQHLAYDAQLEAKRVVVRDALARIGGVALEPPPTQPSLRPWRYRRKLTLALRRRGARWIAGLHPYHDASAVFELRDCPITDERVVAVWKEILGAAGLLPQAQSLRGAVRLVDGGASFVLEGGTRWNASDAFFRAVPSLAALWWRREGGTPRLLAERGAAAAASASFVQVNEEVADALRAHVLAVAAAHAPARIVDAYAGAGATAVPLAAAGARVTAIELDRDASARTASLLPEGSRAIAGRVEDRLGEALPADLVIVNPPRTGVDARVTTILAAATPAPRAIVYVSCNPATLARDIARLPGWRVRSIRLFDMFPQTAHVETVCELVPEAA
ncbi:MAG TPA: class I SAM-dependent RNA methyltransferase [Gemmatimonadaceae bacterium]